MLDKELEASVDAYVAEVWEDVVRDIERLVAHPSVADESRGAEGAPYGPEVRSALDEALAIARRLGYETGNYDGYMGMADVLGYSERQVATIAHLDVVPAGTGWATDPFTMVRRDGWLLGRGVIDDRALPCSRSTPAPTSSGAASSPATRSAPFWAATRKWE